MSTLVLHAPYHHSKTGRKKSYEETLETGTGTDYAINSTLRKRIQIGDKVILLRKDRSPKRAEGTIAKITATGKATGNKIPRYDIMIDDLAECPYRSEPLNRNGVNVI